MRNSLISEAEYKYQENKSKTRMTVKRKKLYEVILNRNKKAYKNKEIRNQ